MLGGVSLLYSCQPSEAYLTRFLLEDKDLTEAALDEWVWPADAIGSLLFFVPMAALSRIGGYRPIVLLGLGCRQATRLILLMVPAGADCLGWMVAMQLCYAAATCADQVLVALAYRVVPPKLYGYATVIMIGSFHVGNLIGSILAQALVSSGVAISTLFWISWVLSSLSLLLFLAWAAAMRLRCLPGSGRLAAADRALCCDGATACASASTTASPATDTTATRRCCTAARMLQKCREVLVLYRDPRAQLFSLWWVFGWSAHNIVGNYYQQLFIDVAPSRSSAPLGSLAALIEASCLVGAFAFGLVPHCAKRAPLATVALSAAACAIVLGAAVVGRSPVLVDGAIIASFAIYHYIYACAAATIAHAVSGAAVSIAGEQGSPLPANDSEITVVVGEESAMTDAAFAQRSSTTANNGAPAHAEIGADGPFASVFALNSCAALLLTTVLLRVASSLQFLTRGIMAIATVQYAVLAAIVCVIALALCMSRRCATN